MSYSDEINYNQPPEEKPAIYTYRCSDCGEVTNSKDGICGACGSDLTQEIDFFDFDDNNKEFEHE